MRVVIRQFEVQGGAKVAVDRTLDTERVRIGRGTDQHVLVPDLRVALAHAELTLRPRGPYLLTSLGGNAVWINGAPATVKEVTFGDRLDFGRYRITIGQPDYGVDLLLEVEEQVSAREEKSLRAQQFPLTLDQAGASKRPVAWLLFLLILLPGIAIPAALRFLPAFADSGLSLEQVWEAGPPSAAHSHFLRDCDTCHQLPFVRVRNDACLDCHAGRPHHSDDPQLLAEAGLASPRCESCHKEHGGPDALVAHAPELCTACHAQPDARFPGADLQPALDFAGAHPVFTARVPRYTPGREFTFEEVRLDAGARVSEQTNLAFPHDLHLDPQGIAGPDGTERLECGSCHVADAAGALFEPVAMEPHCGRCHRLDFDPDDPQRVLPHGEPAEIASIVRDYYAHRALAGAATGAPRERRRPGVAGRAEGKGLSWADERAAQTLADLFERRVCTYCHQVEAGTDPATPWQVAPVMQTPRYLTGARFDHAAHRTEDCASCHDSAKSKDSRDVSLPPLERCRDCHGDVGATALVPTPCIGCHGFHIATRATIGGAGTVPGGAP